MHVWNQSPAVPILYTAVLLSAVGISAALRPTAVQYIHVRVYIHTRTVKHPERGLAKFYGERRVIVNHGYLSSTHYFQLQNPPPQKRPIFTDSSIEYLQVSSKY